MAADPRLNRFVAAVGAEKDHRALKQRAFYSPSKPDWPHGLEGAHKIIATAVDAIPDLASTVEDIFAEGDKVTVRWTFRGTVSRASFARLSETGERFMQGAISIYRFANGKIEEDWSVGEFSASSSSWGD